MRFKEAIQIALTAVVVLAGIHALDLVLPYDLRLLGIRPRDIGGLTGIVFAPLLHGSLQHLIANCSALLVLITLALTHSRKLAASALGIIIGLGGTLVWIFGSSAAIHIGASGVVFGLIGYLLFVGLFRREWVALAISAAVLFAYGGTLLSLLRFVPGVSWSSHFFGFLAGVVSAWWAREKR